MLLLSCGEGEGLGDSLLYIRLAWVHVGPPTTRFRTGRRCRVLSPGWGTQADSCCTDSRGLQRVCGLLGQPRGWTASRGADGEKEAERS